MLSNVSIWQLLIVLVIVIAIFGTKRLKTLGSDLGGAVKGFRSAMDDADKTSTEQILVGAYGAYGASWGPPAGGLRRS